MVELKKYFGTLIWSISSQMTILKVQFQDGYKLTCILNIGLDGMIDG